MDLWPLKVPEVWVTSTAIPSWMHLISESESWIPIHGPIMEDYKKYFLRKQTLGLTTRDFEAPCTELAPCSTGSLGDFDRQLFWRKHGSGKSLRCLVYLALQLWDSETEQREVGCRCWLWRPGLEFLFLVRDQLVRPFPTEGKAPMKTKVHPRWPQLAHR